MGDLPFFGSSKMRYFFHILVSFAELSRQVSQIQPKQPGQRMRMKALILSFLFPVAPHWRVI